MSGQVVQITINVTDGNASEAVQQVVAQLNAIGPAGEAAGAEAGAGLDQVGEHALSARENVRLLNDDLGLRIPRAMQAAIMQSQALTGAISMIGPGLIAMGAVDILMHMGEEIRNGYEKWVELKDVIAESEAVVKAFGEAGTSALEKQNSAMERYIRLTQGAQAGDKVALQLLQDRPIDLSKQYQSDDYKKLPDSVKGDFEKITGESVMPKDLDETISKLQTYEQTLKNSLADVQAAKSGAVLGGQYSEPQLQQMEKLKQSIGIGASIMTDLQQQQGAYNAETQAQQAQIGKDKPGTEDEQQALQRKKETQAALAALDEKALESQLQGIPLLEAQRKYAEDQWVSQHGQSVRAIADIDAGFYKSEADFNNKQADENKKKNDAIAAAQKQFNQELEQVTTRSDDTQISGYARIAADGERSIARIEQAYQKLSQTAGITTAQLQTARASADQDEISIRQNVDNEMVQLHQKSMDQIAKEEEQTARQSLPEWEQAALKIQDEWQDKVRAIDLAEDEQLAHVKNNATAIAMVTAESDAQRAAAHRLMIAQMEQSEEEMRDKIASGLQSMFSNPTQFFEKRAMDTAFQLMANEMLSVFKSSSPAGGILQYLFGMGPQMSTSTNPLNAMESALGIGHGGTGTAQANPAMMTFQQGSTTLLTASQALLQAAGMMQSSSGTAGFGGGFSGGGSTFGLPLSAGGSASSTSAGMAGMSSGLSTTDVSLPDQIAVPGVSNLDNLPAVPPMAGGGTMSAIGGIAGGALMGATSIYSAYKDSNPVAGAVGGGMGGMETGAALGSIIPGLGTAAGAIIGGLAGAVGGLLAGIFGDKGRGQAESLDVNTIQPELAKDLQDYEQGRSGYNQLFTAINSMKISAQNQTSQWGSGARNYFDSNIVPEINVILSSLQKQERGGRSAVTMSAAQYHDGGWTGDFGDLATSDNEGFIHAMANEFVVNPMAAQQHGPLLSAINSGNVSYSSHAQPRMPAAGAGATVNLTIQALDSKSVAQWAKAGGGSALVAAINQAQRQYSGIGRG